MIESLYQLLARWGYTHPIHPIFVHLPIGLVFGALLFFLAAVLSRRSDMAQSARHCCVLALIMFFPAVLSGFADWMHFYAGDLMTIFKVKMALAGAFLIFLFMAVAVGGSRHSRSGMRLLLYLCCLLIAGGLGYVGGQLVYG